MTLTFDELGTESDEQNGGWRYPRRAVFLGSTAYDTLERELRSYVDGTITGRSFLIAAHRGVGKTSLVLRAVEDIERARVLKPASEAALGRQRPLLVKLHGSSLLDAPERPKPDDKPSLSPGQKVADSVANLVGRVTGAPEPGRADPPRASAEIALQQITIALYRSLAREVAASFTRHAAVQSRVPIGRRGAGPLRSLLELAGQLTLDLDLAPDVAALRHAWEQLDRLGAGVLWPGPKTDPASTQLVPVDFGLREIVAIATANQAFQVCSGRVEATRSAKQSAERDASVETRMKLDLKDVANRFWALTAGALVGTAALQATSVPAAIGAGVAASLVSSLLSGFSVTRRDRRERSVDYSFIVDRTIQTLDRDLPVVIERVRKAGLAPVFLVDELDKLERPAECIATIISRLKNLTTDYGFFCFLTDRGYYEEIERKVREEAYPAEHTFFSHRLLVLYRPAELARYVHSLWSPGPGALSGEPLQLQARWVLTCACLHRGKLNLTDVRREIARLCDRAGTLIPDVNTICGTGQFLLPMAMQLALEHVLRQRDVRRRVEVDNGFAQLAFEVLYVIARAWYDGRDTVDLGLEAVRAELIGQRHLDGSEAARKEQLAKFVPEADLVMLVGKAKSLAELLGDFRHIREQILLERDFLSLPESPPAAPFADPTQSEPAKLAALSSLLLAMPGFSPGLLARQPASDGSPDVFRFMFDCYGVERSEDALDAQLESVRDAIRFVGQLEAGLRDSDCSLADLFQGGVLPPTLNPAAIEDSIARLREIDDPELIDTMRADVTLVRGIPSTLEGLGRALVALSALAVNVREDASRVAGLDVGAAAAFASTDQLLGNVALVEMLSAAPGRTGQRRRVKSSHSEVARALANSKAPGAIDSAGAWQEAIAADRAQLRAAFQGDAPSYPVVAEAWRSRLSAWLAGRARGARQVATPLNPPILYTDLVCLAAGLPLPGLLRPDLGTLTIAEWSHFCMMMDRAGSDAPAWGLVAGLAALGFGNGVLRAAIDRAGKAPRSTLAEVEAAAAPFLEPGSPDRPYVLLVTPDGSRLGALVPNPAEQLTFAVPEDSFDDYIELATWLRDNGDELGPYKEQL